MLRENARVCVCVCVCVKSYMNHELFNKTTSRDDSNWEIDAILSFEQTIDKFIEEPITRDNHNPIIAPQVLKLGDFSSMISMLSVFYYKKK